MAAIARASYRVEVGWSQYSKGLFTFGYSLFGSADVLAGDSWSRTFTGPYDNITAPGDGTRVERITFRRGREDDLSAMRAGECTLQISDPIAKYNRKNPSSVLAGNLVPFRPVRVVAVSGPTLPSPFTYPVGLFYGFIDTIEWAGGRRKGTATIRALDFLSRMNPPGEFQFVRPVLASAGATTTGAAIGRLLDAMEWRDPAMRSLAAGDAIPDFSTDGTKTVLAVVEELLLAERGLFFPSASGVVTFMSRHQRDLQASKATIVNVLTALKIGVDPAKVVNKWRVTRTGGAEQVASDAASDRQYGTIESSLGPTPYLANDAQSLSLAQYLLSRTKDPVSPVWELSLEAVDGPTLAQMLVRELGDRVTVTEAKTPSTADYFIEQVTHEIDARGGSHGTSWRLSERPASNPFVFGTSTFGGADVLTY